MNTNTNITQNNLSIEDTGTYTVAGSNDTITAASAVSDITILAAASPRDDVFFLGARNSTVIDNVTTGNDTINGHGSENITVGAGDVVHLFGNETETVVGAGNDSIFLGASGSDTVTVTGSDNNIRLGAGNSSVTITSGGGDIIQTFSNANYNVTDNGTGSIIHADFGTFSLSGSAADTIYEQVLGNHTLTLGSGADTVIVRDGTILAHLNHITINGFADGLDTIELSGGLNKLASVTGILSHITDVGGNATLSLNGQTITLVGVAVAALHVSDFTIG